MRKNYVALDVETTGLNPAEDEIIEVAAVTYRDGHPAAEFNSLVRPCKPVPPSVTLITGISQEILTGAPPAEQVLSELRPWLEGAIVLAHNAQFDLAFLGNTARRLSLPGFQYAGVIDTLELARLVIPLMKSHRLSALASQLGIPCTHSHRALVDARAEAQVFHRLLELLPGLGKQLITQLLEVMRDSPWPFRDVFEDALSKCGEEATPTRSKSMNVQNTDVITATRSVNPGDVEDILGVRGAASRTIPGFEFRPGQLQMAYLTLEAFNERKHVVIEAGTGSGKSLAYLVPAALWATGKGEKVVVATHTINLQEQLITKDIPIVERLIGKKLNTVVVKGRNNYLCMRKWGRFVADLKTRKPEARRSSLRLLCWAAKTTTGDCSEISLTPEEEVLWKEVRSDSKSCMGAACAFRNGCFALAAREGAEKANIIVTNHAMLFSDLATDNRVLPEYSYAIIDEAHHMEDAATHALGGRVSSRELRDTLNGLLTHGAIGKKLQRSRFFDVLENAKKALGAVGPDTPEKCLAIASQLRELASWLMDFARDETDPEVERDAMAESLDLAAKAGIMERAVRDEDPMEAGWVEACGEETVFSYAPLWVGEALAERFFDGLKGSVMTSATLSVAGDFEGFLKRSGLYLLPAERVHTEIIESPFRYDSQAFLCVPTDLAAPSRRETDQFSRQGMALLKEICQLCGGKTIVLFTSYSMMKEFEQGLRGPLMARGINLLCQGIDGNRTAITELFPRVQPAVIFGTASFWEGLDMPQDSLVCVVIVKLPFEVPDSPLPRARARCIAEGGGNPFEELALPNAVLRFKQGFGRLIRRRTDRGVVVVLDRRLVDSRYGRVFVESLPQPATCFAPSAEVLRRIKEWLETR